MCGLWQLTCKCTVSHLIVCHPASSSQLGSLWFDCDLWFSVNKTFFVNFRAHQAIPQFPYHPGMAGMAGMAGLFYQDALGGCIT